MRTGSSRLDRGCVVIRLFERIVHALSQPPTDRRARPALSPLALVADSHPKFLTDRRLCFILLPSSQSLTTPYGIEGDDFSGEMHS